MSVSHTFRLLSFNVYDDEREQDEEEEGSYKSAKNKDFIVQMFGVNEKGKTASIFVEGFTPFFYVMVGDDWTEGTRMAFIGQLYAELQSKYWEGTIVKSQFVKRKKLYGFDAGKKSKFLLLKFTSEQAMRKFKNLWYVSKRDRHGNYQRKLAPYKFAGHSTELYEAQIPPLLRMFHVREMSPSGWISLPHSKVFDHKDRKTTSCDHEFTINYKSIIPLPNKETRVPYKICSFDIEASSSHGDFPLAVKNYKKLAQNIVNQIDERHEGEDMEDFLRRAVLTAFSLERSPVYGVDVVYPKEQPTGALVKAMLDRWIKMRPKEECKNADGDDDDGDDDDDDEVSVAGAEGEKEEQVEEVTWGRPKKTVNGYKKTGTVVDLMEDSSVDSDTKIMELNKTLSSIFPKLKGDIVTFIGSTFLRYGDSKPYMNHCIVRDTCSEMPHVENSVLESYASEKEVLLAWTRLIQREDPDIVIGYNIFGFDYQFMYQRSRELGITRPFLQLSRNKGEVCLKKNWKTGKEGLEENTIVIASGQHDLKFVNMTGRLQIDLYNYLRRDYNLTKYKLDYVSGYFIGDGVKSIAHEGGNTIVKSGNLSGLDVGSYINFEEEAHSVDNYKDGAKFQVIEIDKESSTFSISSEESPDMTKKVRWGLAKDDVTPQDIFRMTNEGPDERALIAKYCIQDCNLVHHLLNKIDVITGYVEMANLCSVPLDFLVMRGQGIKLTSYLAKKCREKGTLMPVLDKANSDEGYEGAIVLPPKSDLYLEEPVACVDYSSLYPSSMISENISPDSKVWTKEYDLDGNLLQESGERDKDGNFMYDNLPNYKYVDISYDAYSWRRKTPSNPKSAMMKVKVGTKTCRFAQFPDGELGILPSILKECLAARKATRKLIPQEKDEFMKNVLDKRQLSIKVTANSMYGQTGAKTSTFYEKDVAASTTATGRKLLTYAQRVIEEAYKDRTVVTKEYGEVRTNAEYVYGDTDSVFFKFNLTELDGTPILGQKALKITIELAQQAGELATMFLKAPHDLEYEKTFLPFCLLSKKRYVGMLYELDPNKCKRKSMGIVLKRRDNAPVVKDVYGGIIDILMKDKDIEKAARFLEDSLRSLVDGEIGLDKLVITKSLRGHYKNPKQIAHKVLADRIGRRDPGNKPSVGDRVAFAYFSNPDRKALQGDKIETPDFIASNNLPIDYAHYITNQIMKPVQQVFALVLENMTAFKKKKGFTLRRWHKQLEDLRKQCNGDEEAYARKVESLRKKEVKELLFQEYLTKIQNKRAGHQSIADYFSVMG